MLIDKQIAVISSSVKDFKLWKKENNIRGDILDSTHKVILGNTTYHSILTPCDVCSLAVNDIIETKNAKNNKHYEEIMLNIKRCLIIEE